MDIRAHVVFSISNLNKQLTLKKILVENKGPPPPPFGFKQMPIPIVAIGHAMVYLNAKRTAFKCAIL